MCGIAGIFSLDQNCRIDTGLAGKMADSIVHRGPDAFGQYIDKNNRGILTFRRLSIIDLSTGMQPLSNEDSSIHLICNGEIYNFQSLRDELKGKGHEFRTAGDIEPLVHLYEEYGTDFLNRLDGFFALALYDEKKQKLILAIDRVGKKPIYHTTINGCLYFASELKSLKSIQAAKIDNSAITDYFRFGYIPAPATIFTGINKIPPGHFSRHPPELCPQFDETNRFTGNSILHANSQKICRHIHRGKIRAHISVNSSSFKATNRRRSLGHFALRRIRFFNRNSTCKSIFITSDQNVFSRF